MALRNFASSALSSVGLRAQIQAYARAGAVSARAYSTVMEGLKYMKSHEWAKIEGDVATIGISDHAQSELGDVVYVELPQVGQQVEQGNTFGVVESVKAASDVYSPLSGEVVEVNQALVDKPATVNTDPYSSGWFIKVKMSNKDEASKLLDSAAYSEECDKH